MTHSSSINTPFVHWVDVLRQRAETEPDRLAFGFMLDKVDEEVQYTYAQLDLAARKIAAVLQMAGVEGERAVLFYQPGPEYICALMGCLYAGVTAVPAYVPRKTSGHAHVLRMIEDARATVLLSTAKTLSVLMDQTGCLASLQTGLYALATDTLSPKMADQWYMPRLSGDSLAILQYTSGSTGTPKGVQVRHSHLLTNSRMIAHAMGIDSNSVGIMWLPPYHDMGLIGGILQPMYAGFPVHLMAPATFLQRPIRWLDAISRYRGTISAAPNFAYELCARRIRPDQLEKLDLSTWRVACCGAEPIRANALREFASVFGGAGFDRRAFFPCYGMAETTLYVAGGPLASEVRTLQVSRSALAASLIRPATDEDTCELVSSGWVDGEVNICIVDPVSHCICQAGDIGEIWIRGETVTGGYWRQPAATASVFAARLLDSDYNWLRSGDLGAIVGKDLYVTGRIKDLIVIRGQNHYPQDIEATVQGVHSALRQQGAAAFAVESELGEQLGLILELERHAVEADLSPIAAAVRSAISERHQLHIDHLAFVRPGGVPKTSSGKIQRALARQLLLQGELPIVAMSETNIPCR